MDPRRAAVKKRQKEITLNRFGQLLSSEVKGYFFDILVSNIIGYLSFSGLDIALYIKLILHSARCTFEAV